MSSVALLALDRDKWIDEQERIRTAQYRFEVRSCSQTSVRDKTHGWSSAPLSTTAQILSRSMRATNGSSSKRILDRLGHDDATRNCLDTSWDLSASAHQSPIVKQVDYGSTARERNQASLCEASFLMSSLLRRCQARAGSSNDLRHSPLSEVSNQTFGQHLLPRIISRQRLRRPPHSVYDITSNTSGVIA